MSFRFVFVPGGPSTTHQELVFDFTAPSPVAIASFLSPATLAIMPSDPARVTTEMMRGARLLSSGQRFDVSVVLVVPETPHNAAAGVFQVRAELLDARGDAVANATRPASLRYASREVRWVKLLTRWPFYAAGLAEEKQTMKLPMFVGATEARDAPFVGVRVEVAPRAGAGPEAVPHVYAAHADVELNMGALRKFLYYYPASSFVLMIAVTWGYLCATALALFAIVAALGLVRSPASFAEEVVARAKGMMKGDSDADGYPPPFFGGAGLTSSDDEGTEAGRASSDTAVSSESGASDLGGPSTEGLRYRGAPRPSE